MTETPVRGARARAKLERLKGREPPGIRVVPANDTMRRLLKHPKRGAFPSSGGAVWPDDKYTHRRLKDGSVTREEAEQASPPK